MHPWIWLNEPQHSAAIQAMAAIVFGLVTFVIGALSLRYLNAATFAAAKQAEAASKQIEIMQQQFAADAVRIAEEQRRRAADQRATYESRVAKDDASRPIFRGSGYTSAKYQTMDFTNHGVDAAVDVNVVDDQGKVVASAATVHPNRAITVNVDIEKLATKGYLFLFRSSSGSSWQLRVRGAGATPPLEEVLHVDRPYHVDS
jgi:hypothetical protein